jgi:hypothetical protein
VNRFIDHLQVVTISNYNTIAHNVFNVSEHFTAESSQPLPMTASCASLAASKLRLPAIDICFPPYSFFSGLQKIRHVFAKHYCGVTPLRMCKLHAHKENTAPVLLRSGTCLPSRCLETDWITPLFYYCVLDRFYGDVAWQWVDQIRYSILSGASEFAIQDRKETWVIWVINYENSYCVLPGYNTVQSDRLLLTFLRGLLALSWGENFVEDRERVFLVDGVNALPICWVS